MPLVYLETIINASPQLVFDLSLSVDLHKASMMHHREDIVDGLGTGFMKKGDTVTWKARHLGKTRTLNVKITEQQPPDFFADEMIKGDFKKMRHEHRFRSMENGTLMIDRFYFETPFSILGKAVDFLFLKTYMKRLLLERNAVIKKTAESDQWKQYLHT